MRPDGGDADQEERMDQAANAVIVSGLLGPCLPRGSLCGSPACDLPSPGRDRLQEVHSGPSLQGQQIARRERTSPGALLPNPTPHSWDPARAPLAYSLKVTAPPRKAN